jgi:hypothetical protein
LRLSLRLRFCPRSGYVPVPARGSQLGGFWILPRNTLLGGASTKLVWTAGTSNQQTCIKILCCKARAMELLPLHEIKVLKLRCTAKRCAMDSARRELSIGERAVGWNRESQKFCISSAGGDEESRSRSPSTATYADIMELVFFAIGMHHESDFSGLRRLNEEHMLCSKARRHLRASGGARARNGAGRPTPLWLPPRPKPRSASRCAPPWGWHSHACALQ